MNPFNGGRSEKNTASCGIQSGTVAGFAAGGAFL